MKNIFKQKDPLKYWIVAILRNLFVGVVVTFVISLLSGFQYLNIVSYSMEPTLKVGTIVCIYKNVDIDDLEVGDIVTMKLGSGTYLTHRIIDVNRENGTINTRGDATSAEIDPDGDGYRSVEQVAGKVVYWFPELGNVINFIKQPVNIIFICIAIFLSFFVVHYI